jgi:hypothetical protein
LSSSQNYRVPPPSTRFGIAEGKDPAELGRLGGIRSGEVRREQGKSVREKLREKVEANADKLWSAFEAGLNSNDPGEKRASAVAVLAEAYGRPPQALIGDPDQPLSFELVSGFNRKLNVPAEYPSALEASDEHESHRTKPPTLALESGDEA